MYVSRPNEDARRPNSLSRAHYELAEVTEGVFSILTRLVDARMRGVLVRAGGMSFPSPATALALLPLPPCSIFPSPTSLLSLRPPLLRAIN
jgi:hypothetical protein